MYKKMKVYLPLYILGGGGGGGRCWREGRKKLRGKKSEMFHRGRLSLMLMLI